MNVFVLSGKLTVASWSYFCFSKGRGRSDSNIVIFHLTPPHPKFGAFWVLSWKQMVTGSNPAKFLGNLYSTYPNPIKIPSCFQAHMNLSFRSLPLASSPPWCLALQQNVILQTIADRTHSMDVSCISLQLHDIKHVETAYMPRPFYGPKQCGILRSTFAW